MSVSEGFNVSPADVRAQGAAMESSADRIPDPPDPFTGPGTDELSLALHEKTQQMEAPFINGLRQTRADAQATARNIQTAADKYEKADQDVAGQVQGVAGLGGAGGAGGSGTGGGQGMEQLQQMMQMPMQMAQMAAQVPMQMAQMAGQIPQAVMQGVQQFSQMAGGLGQNADAEAGKPGGEQAGLGQPGDGENPDERDQREDERENRDEGRDEQSPVSGGAAAEAAPADRAPVGPPAATQPSPSPGVSTPDTGSPPVAAGLPREHSDPAIVL
ncbi:hypothetical protein A5719_07630 [Mycolicibacterium peregrinum]|uniref:hypothetical protein n=1 Tax=Mycolicibacterium peregrinum TaxID=43304 RepID=UPI0007EAE352|nr:hypothetical protein [Mycolicibacterium peregrinum]OBF44328.1 hypothetical protein A5719_07630 [Mycolicibacterium peregrinum]